MRHCLLRWRAASYWRVRSASGSSALMCAGCGLLALFSLWRSALDLPKPLERLTLVAWSGPPPAAGSPSIASPDGKYEYYLSRGPVVYLVEQSAVDRSIKRAWVWRLEDAESLHERRPPDVNARRVLVRDLHGDVVLFDRLSGEPIQLERAVNPR